MLDTMTHFSSSKTTLPPYDKSNPNYGTISSIYLELNESFCSVFTLRRSNWWKVFGKGAVSMGAVSGR